MARKFVALSAITTVMSSVSVQPMVVRRGLFASQAFVTFTRNDMNLRVNIASGLIFSAIAYLVACGAASPVLAQDEILVAPPVQDAEETKKVEEELVKKALILLDELITDSASLNGDENRNLALGIAVELLWKHDEKRARILVYQ